MVIAAVVALSCYHPGDLPDTTMSVLILDLVLVTELVVVVWEDVYVVKAKSEVDNSIQELHGPRMGKAWHCWPDY